MEGEMDMVSAMEWFASADEDERNKFVWFLKKALTCNERHILGCLPDDPFEGCVEIPPTKARRGMGGDPIEIAPYDILYFGVWTGTGGGHYMHTADGEHLHFLTNEKIGFPWGETIDCVLQPTADKDKPYDLNRDETQGHAAIHHKNGWTGLCFWDRSEDARGGCNSNFFARGTHTFEEMVELSQKHFSPIWKRFPFKVVLVETHDESEV